jgi:hypothetical protein
MKAIIKVNSPQELEEVLSVISGLELIIQYQKDKPKPDYTKSERANKVNSNVKDYNRKCKRCGKYKSNLEFKNGLCLQCQEGLNDGGL